jgi:hypothetical protein
MKKKRAKVTSKSKIPRKDFPLYCDFLCPFASFPPADAVGACLHAKVSFGTQACRREQAVYCQYAEKFATQSSTCLMRL